MRKFLGSKVNGRIMGTLARASIPAAFGVLTACGASDDNAAGNDDDAIRHRLRDAGALDATATADAAATADVTAPDGAAPDGGGQEAGIDAGGPIPASRRTDWTFTGVPGGIPNRTNVCATFSPGASAAAINAAIASCNDGVVYLSAGTYSAASLGGTINVNNSNVTLRGAGADKTILTGASIVGMTSGGNNPLGTPITGGATKGSTQLTVQSTSGRRSTARTSSPGRSTMATRRSMS